VVLVHGLSPQGKNDPRLQEAARLLARAGFRVLVPTVPGLTTLRLRPDDAETVVQAIQALKSWGSVQVLGISVGAGPALLAATDPRVAAEVSAVLSLGGYASTVELLRYFLTGTYHYGAVSGRATPDPRAVTVFIQANADLLDDAVLRLVENRDPARVERLVQNLSPQLRELLETLSPERVIGGLRGRLLLLHGKNDPAVPFTESLRLADAARGRVPTRLVLLGVVGHVEPEAAPRGKWATARELLTLWALTYEFFSL
jgi:pimeloyl-ACP methyl ester carboxylesterase